MSTFTTEDRIAAERDFVKARSEEAAPSEFDVKVKESPLETKPITKE